MKKVHAGAAGVAAAIAMVAGAAVGPVFSGVVDAQGAGNAGSSVAQGPGPNVGGSGSAGDTVTVTGYAMLPAQMSSTSLQANITITDASVAGILKDESSLQAQITSLLRKAGIPQGDIQTQASNLNFSSTNNINGNFNVTVQVSGAQTVRAMDVFSSVSGKSYIQNLWVNTQQYPVGVSTLREKLFQMALSDAKVQATVLATDAGERVGPVVSMTTQGPGGATPNGMGYAPPFQNAYGYGGVQAANYQNGLVGGLSAQVTVTYQLLS